MANKIPLLVIAGPTATGKSAVAVSLAKELDGEIISADSMQVYKYMDIGTAKVDWEIRKQIPHHLLDLVEPDADFSLALYKDLADKAIKDTWHRGRLPIMAGGTGLYIRAVVENYPLAELPYSAACRAEIEREWEQRGGDYMLAQLETIDPGYGAKARDKRRIVRALEIYRLSGRNLTEIQRESKKDSPYQPWVYALTLPRELLYSRINARALAMIKEGLIGEYSGIIAKGYAAGAKALQGLGYFHAGMYVSGRWNEAEMLSNLQRDTRRYAKRQLSWFRSMPAVKWLDNSDPRLSLLDISASVAGELG